MRADDLVLVQGMEHTRLTLARWNRTPVPVLLPWLRLSVGIAVGLLLAINCVARLAPPDPTRYAIAGYSSPAGAADYLGLVYRNSLVLALHALACVAGFIAGSSLPLAASKRSGASRWVHERAGPLAIAFVLCATAFSLCTQAYALGLGAGNIAGQLGVSPAKLLLALTPHALPELTALFLPLAAWMIERRRGDWHELLAATLVTVCVAVPVLLATAAVELWFTPRILEAISS
ncbi:MAG TPA: hypothetical protein VEQ61_04380 [Thermoleophilaceae bacterium]|nr:hypothetical protein [Thermoleophilaceae bacterium]